MSNPVNAVLIGYGRAELRFPCEVLEDPSTGSGMVSYTPVDCGNCPEILTQLEFNENLDHILRSPVLQAAE